jgi:hypothetical protein
LLSGSATSTTSTTSNTAGGDERRTSVTPIVSIDRMVLPHEDALLSESICHQRTSTVENMMTTTIHGRFFFFFLFIYTKDFHKLKL